MWRNIPKTIQASCLTLCFSAPSDREGVSKRGGPLRSLGVIIGRLQSLTQRSSVVSENWHGCLSEHMSICASTGFQVGL